MNFWRAHILRLLLAAAAVMGLTCSAEAAVKRSDLCELDARSTQISLELGAHSFQVKYQGAALSSASDQEDDPFSPRKRTRKCWRPEQKTGVGILIPVQSPAERPWLEVKSHFGHVPSPAPSDMLFIVGGYIRLFQKG